MKKYFFAILLFFLIHLTHSQKKISFGFNFGLGKNYFDNSYSTDNNHFSFKRPTSIILGAQVIKFINHKNQVVAQFNYITKRVKFNYSTNEPTIPYNVNDEITDKYDCVSLAIGYRKPFQIKRMKFFAQIDLATDYNVNVAQSSSGTGNGNGNEITKDILFSSFRSNNLGEKSVTIGSIFSVGLYLGKKKNAEINLGINIPFNNIHNKTSTYQYTWSYQGKEIMHNLNYKGSIIYPHIRYTYYVFNK